MAYEASDRERNTIFLCARIVSIISKLWYEDLFKLLFCLVRISYVKVENIICKSIYDSIINGDPLKYAQSSGIVEVATIVPLLVACRRL